MTVERVVCETRLALRAIFVILSPLLHPLERLATLKIIILWHNQWHVPQNSQNNVYIINMLFIRLSVS